MFIAILKREIIYENLVIPLGISWNENKIPACHVIFLKFWPENENIDLFWPKSSWFYTTYMYTIKIHVMIFLTADLMFCNIFFQYVVWFCSALDDFNYGVVLTNRTLRPEELFEVHIDKMVDKWAGSIEIGVTLHSPNDLDFPSTMTNMRSGTWMMTGTGVMHNGTTVIDMYGQNLDRLKVWGYPIVWIDDCFWLSNAILWSPGFMNCFKSKKLKLIDAAWLMLLLVVIDCILVIWYWKKK